MARLNPYSLGRSRSPSQPPSKPAQDTEMRDESASSAEQENEDQTEPSRPRTPDRQPDDGEPRSARSGIRGTPRRSPMKQLDNTGSVEVNRARTEIERRDASPRGSRPVRDEPRKQTRGREDPDLPLTPRQRGLADPDASTPPSGIHNTPSRRSRRASKTSPLKQRADVNKRQAEPLERPSRSRYGPLADRFEDKKRLRDQLAEEVKQLRADLQLAERESERLRYLHRTGRSDTAEPPNAEDILALLLRSVPQIHLPKAKIQKTSILQNIGAFLPFAPRKRPEAVVPVEDKPIASHLPVPMEKPLPFLTVFTPLQFSSSIEVIPAPSNAPTDAPLQLHSITAKSPSGLFNARVDITVSTDSFSVLSLSIPRLDTAAEAEYGTWARHRASRRAELGRDVNALFWAMSRWTETAKRRAAFWCTIEKEFGTPAATRQTVTQLKRKLQIQERKRQAQTPGIQQPADITDEVHSTWKRKDLLPHMGRKAMTITLPDNVELHLVWSIGFDWTGETESKIEARSRTPQSWHDIDDRKSLPRVPVLFDKLVAEHGIVEAVRAVVLLLSGSEL